MNTSRDDGTVEVERDHEPLFVLDTGPVFEVWYYHHELRRYFCMTRGPHLAPGVVYFHPDDVPNVLRERIEMFKKAG